MIIKGLNTETYKVRLHTLTPVYIGCGDEYDLTSFWVDEQKGELVEFMPEAFVSLLSEDEKNILGNIGLLELARLINQKKPKGISKKICLNLVQKYEKVLYKQQTELNKFEIKKTAFNPTDNMPYVPGASLKGALRTVYIASLCPKLSYKNSGEPYIDEAGLLGGNFDRSPFSALKVSDFMTVVKDSCSPVSIVFADRISKKERKGGFKHLSVTMLEIINPGTVFEGTISLTKNNNIPKPLPEICRILECIDRYSFSLLEDEKMGIRNPPIEKIRGIKNSFGKKAYLCRIGGYIGAESHTIQGCRKIKIRKHDIREYSTMTVYASPQEKMRGNSGITLGWCVLEIVENDNLTENKCLADFAAEQMKTLLPEKTENSDGQSHNNHTVYNKQNMNTAFMPSQQKMSFDRNGVYDAEVIKISKKGNPMVEFRGNELTVMDAVDLKIGDKIKITKIYGTTCRIKEI